MLNNLVMDLLDFRLAIFPHTNTHTRANPDSEVQVAKEGAVWRRVFLLAVAARAEVCQCPSTVAVLASRATEGCRAFLGYRDSSARLSASGESESVQS